MRNLNISWKIMCDPAEQEHFRTDSEADVREHAQIGMVPTGAGTPKMVLEACRRVRRRLGIEIGPQPIRFTENELRFLIAAVDTVEFGDQVEIQGIINKLRHREKTMRSARNRDRKEPS